MWRKRSDHEVRELEEDLDMVADIQNKKLEWIGQLVRMHHGSVVKKIFGSEPEGRRMVGRPGWRWLEDAEKDLWEVKVKIWRHKAVDREEWTSVIKVANALRGL